MGTARRASFQLVDFTFSSDEPFRSSVKGIIEAFCVRLWYVGIAGFIFSLYLSKPNVNPAFSGSACIYGRKSASAGVLVSHA